MNGLFCSLSFFMFLTLRLVKRFVQKKLVVEYNPVAADVSPRHLKSFRKDNEPTHVGCYNIFHQLCVRAHLSFLQGSVSFWHDNDLDLS